MEDTDIDMSVEPSECNTILDWAFRSRLGRPLVGWLSRRFFTDLDVDHRNAKGKTLLMLQVSCAIDLAECLDNMKDLLARGASLDARVLDKSETSPHDIGGTALHLAAQCGDQPERHFFEKAKYLLSQGANPHARTLTGHTVTDWVLEFGWLQRFLDWRKILLEVGFELKAFVRKEIDAHVDVPWYASTGCDEFVVEMFGFMPKYDVTTDTFQFLTISEADIKPTQNDYRHLTPAEENSLLHLFDDTDSEPEHDSSSDSDYQSADEDIPRPRWKRMMDSPYVYRTPESSLLGGLSRYRSGEVKPSVFRRNWQAYTVVLETGDPESLLARDQRMLPDSPLAEYGLLIRSQSG